jgi:F-type H+-transporting ATPase subunit delta
MQGVSRAALAALGDELDRVAETTEDLQTVGTELFAVSALLGREPTLRRLATDAARSADDRSGLLTGLLSGKVSRTTLDLVASAVSQRWSRPRDLADAIDQAATAAVVAGAEKADRLDALEDELFRFRRILLGEPRLLAVLTDRSVDPQHKAELVDGLVGDRVTPETQALLRQAVIEPRGESVLHVLERYSAITASRRERVVAHVRTTTDLTDDQRRRLAAALATIYGRAVTLAVEIDPEVLGGLSVRVGDEVVDATVASRLDEARRRLAG